MLEPHQAKTYRVSQPIATHFREASCMEVNCAQLENGWLSAIDEGTNLGQAQAYYIRKESGRRFTEYRAVPHERTNDVGETYYEYERSASGPITVFIFPPGQKCFAQHKVSLDRPSKFTVRDGNVAGNPRGTPAVARNARDWVDDFANHQEMIAKAHKEG